MYLILLGSLFTTAIVALLFNKNISYEDILTFIRCLGICLVVLPLCFIYSCYFSIRNRVRFLFLTSHKEHKKKVDEIINQIHFANKNYPDVPLCTGRPGWENMSPHNAKYKKKFHKININLYDILEVNIQKCYIRVEPMVSMGQISSTLLPLGWILPVLPELDDLTIGGLINGCGIESSSHKYGLFQSICTAFEVILPNGKLIKCSKDENSELFYSIPWSHGTLGFLVAAYLQIIPAKKYVCLEYYPIKGDLTNICDRFSEACNETSYDFIEGLQYSKEEAVIMKGNMVEEVGDGGIVNPINAFYKPWFYLYVRQFLSRYPDKKLDDKVLECVHKDYIPLKQYYHRHTKSLFWELEHMIPFGNHYFFRYLFGWMLPLKVSFLKLTLTEGLKAVYEKLHVAQDILVPCDSLNFFLEHCHQNFEVYPVWLCPMKLFPVNGMVRPRDNKGQPVMYVDVGLYGMPKAKAFVPGQSLHDLENLLIKHRGFEMFYGDVYMTKDEFSDMMNLGLYERLRVEYKCQGSLPHVYDKVNKKARG